MILKHSGLKIDDKYPFSECKLGREKYARVLSKLVGSYADGFVLAINNKWGTGKTTFVKMWKKTLENEELKTCYFNAWENDFDSDPIIAIISELRSIIGKDKNESYKSLLAKGNVFAKNIIPAITKGIAKRYLDTEILNDALEKAAEGLTEIISKQVDDYARKKEGLNEFRNELEKYIQSNVQRKPLIFIIDELDRCRPDYAVRMLECIKHFFSVPGIVFVLVIDKNQLMYAIEGFYGSHKIDSEDYLRRFIDLEYSIPEPSIKEYCRYLFSYFELDQFFSDAKRRKHPELREEREGFILFSEGLFEEKYLTLRQLEKFYAHVRIVFTSVKETYFSFPLALITLLYIRQYHSVLYDRIKKFNISYQELSDKLFEIWPEDVQEDLVQYFRNIEAMLLVLYTNDYRSKNSFSVLIGKIGAEGEESLNINLPKKSQSDISEFIQLIKKYERQFDRTGIRYIIEKIDLMEDIIID